MILNHLMAMESFHRLNPHVIRLNLEENLVNRFVKFLTIITIFSEMIWVKIVVLMVDHHRCHEDNDCKWREVNLIETNPIALLVTNLPGNKLHQLNKHPRKVMKDKTEMLGKKATSKSTEIAMFINKISVKVTNTINK